LYTAKEANRNQDKEFAMVANPELIVTRTIGMSLVLGCLVTVASIAGTMFIIRIIVKKVGPDQEALKNGVPAQARILSVQQTGVMVNDQPQVAFRLEVYPPVGSPYQTTFNAIIPIVHIPQFQPGAEVPVKIHPTNPMKVAFAR
jgi:hypothetical protein